MPVRPRAHRRLLAFATESPERADLLKKVKAFRHGAASGCTEILTPYRKNAYRKNIAVT